MLILFSETEEYNDDFLILSSMREGPCLIRGSDTVPGPEQGSMNSFELNDNSGPNPVSQGRGIGNSTRATNSAKATFPRHVSS